MQSPPLATVQETEVLVDYRGLNNLAIEDKFPLHATVELLDELHGFIPFSPRSIWGMVIIRTEHIRGV